jgi:pSer/pThr/pTyr-binding forkhead associated (FHA) protein
MRVRLISVDGGENLDVQKEMTIIGRKEHCDLTIDHKSVSKQHCVILRADGAVFLRDLGSTNGTSVNGQRVRRAALLPNDLVQIAGFRFKVHFGAEEPARNVQEYTQQMSPEDVARLKKKLDEPSEEDINLDGPVIQQNELPDVIE